MALRNIKMPLIKSVKLFAFVLNFLLHENQTPGIILQNGRQVLCTTPWTLTLYFTLLLYYMHSSSLIIFGHSNFCGCYIFLKKLSHAYICLVSRATAKVVV